jgi:hypothetical protein
MGRGHARASPRAAQDPYVRVDRRFAGSIDATEIKSLSREGGTCSAELFIPLAPPLRTGAYKYWPLSVHRLEGGQRGRRLESLSGPRLRGVAANPLGRGAQPSLRSPLAARRRNRATTCSLPAAGACAPTESYPCSRRHYPDEPNRPYPANCPRPRQAQPRRSSAHARSAANEPCWPRDYGGFAYTNPNHQRSEVTCVRRHTRAGRAAGEAGSWSRCWS